MPGYWGLAYREKGPAPATKYFSGNAVSVAAMCAESHQYRPLLAALEKRIAYSLVQ